MIGEPMLSMWLQNATVTRAGYIAGATENSVAEPALPTAETARARPFSRYGKLKTISSFVTSREPGRNEPPAMYTFPPLTAALVP